jgi:hypothetical protein
MSVRRRQVGTLESKGPILMGLIPFRGLLIAVALDQSDGLRSPVGGTRCTGLPSGRRRLEAARRVGSSHFILLYRCHLAALGLLASTSGYDRLRIPLGPKGPPQTVSLALVRATGSGDRHAP